MFVVVSTIFTINKVYGPIDLGNVTSAFYSNESEILSYLDTITWDVYRPVIGLFVYIVIGFFLPRNSGIKKRIRGTLATLGIEAIARLWWWLYSQTIARTYIVPIDEIINISSLYNQVANDHQKMLQGVDGFGVGKIIKPISYKKGKTIVVVIDESVRKDMLHAYGFPLQNTPRIESSPHIQFNQYLSVANSTVLSLLRTIAWSPDKVHTAIENSIIMLGNTIGYDTVWISNQWKEWIHDTPITMMAKQAKKSLFLNDGDFSQVRTYDDEMLPFFQKVLEEKREREEGQLIVLHRMGVHANVCDKVRKVEKRLWHRDLSCYNQAIKELDVFLQKIYELLKSERKDFNLVYVSDHGVVAKRRITHGFVKQSYEVPLMIWGSDITKNRSIDVVRVGFDFIYMMTELMWVVVPSLSQKHTFISDDNVYPQKEEVELFIQKNGSPHQKRAQKRWTFPDNNIHGFLKKMNIILKE